jgi:hypothetical protein
VPPDWLLNGGFSRGRFVSRKSQFSPGELYAFEAALKTAHPENRNIRPKIRQQLQILRDLGLIEFMEPGKYAIRH